MSPVYELPVVTRNLTQELATPLYTQKLLLNLVDQWRAISRYSPQANYTD
jgi:hypothetical protein